ncbi:alanine--tRNA ligase [Bacillus cereus]|uniref:Alanine--tRNA ligase n=1 Tax=Bacillus thuringiensis subsp. konkukian (strain 97-27) TaxID=281309 RepID=SYA_BACHK|nr:MULTISPECIES: alanine--tRNA ligase [Bacillus]Q6HDD7.1 RecName: Full=Alanine--tRNA ligase; AltName: Full=Alanyl-tRNA synthetase; Short=AlaRS [[Bacillus thuringiensis] serovar konkukian str. 97-27]AAT63904.1 alanine--tRNA ligase (alanyl-tRNA synthetase) [[Bacillus thuringiensis] serovar konkukian str. 97-27]AJI32129.1 alanine--tRNA ligase [Bacillus thuringiensis]MCC0758546.1 alanine--tRNA ligase [Bacillus sp. BRTN]MCC0770603.1 alanine--tRNA ligase [Bacillus pacificus]MDA1849607.1 alanine--tR
MKQLTGAQIRQMFLDFFQEKGHAVEPSASLVPHEDPSLLWINSGVATLKKYFDGRVIPQNPRITNAQKSIRTNDIENVGKTARHHTFFEMLGNFSIGDYFKEEAITWAWEFLTSDKWIGFDKELLSVTIHPEDEEAFTIWNEKMGVPKERIIRLEENFWDIGEGPSGPNTEIFYDRGEAYGNDFSDPELYPGGENERYLEVWNLVFSQFNHNPDGSYTPLPKKNIDTGMGLERMTSIVQDVPTNFDTDLFMPMIGATETISGEKYRNGDLEKDMAFKVIADHIRTVTFAVGDGALPSNEGRGYVLRRLLRRAVRYSKKLNINRPFMFELVPVVGEVMKDFYPEVLEKKDFIAKVVKNEEERFHETLHDGEAILAEVIAKAKEEKTTVISGVDAFRLYDTYGFPIELTEEYAEEAGMTVDQEGFENEMEKQRERARAARQDVDSMQVQGGVLGEVKVASEFVGYGTVATESNVVALVKNGEYTDSLQAGEEGQLMLNVTPFYAESGGQIADRGYLLADGVKVLVKDVQKAPNGQNLHKVVVEEGTLTKDAAVKAIIDTKNRGSVVKNHTATHLLHQALKDVLGTHVNQAGSLVTSERLRFDFSHFGQVQADELEKIERIVNEKIWESIDVEISQKAIEEAKEMGAMALFGEKYGDVVRVVQVGDYSLELCGGCHVDNTASIGIFKIVAESGIGAGTRRIEAVTGKSAYELMNDQVGLLKEAAGKMKTNPKDILTRVDGLFAEVKQLQKENESLAAKLSNIEAGNLTDSVMTVDGVNVLAAKVNVADMNNLRTMMDDLKNKLESAVVVLASVNDDKVNILAGVTKDLISQGYHAGKLVKEVASRCGGGGGGRPDMAQAGGKNPAQVEEALAFVQEYVKSVSK